MRHTATTSIILTSVLAVAATAGAQTKPDSAAVKGNVKQRSTEKPAQQAPAVDPKALEALTKMGAFLRSQKSFTVETTTTTDYVLDTGQKVQKSSHGDLQVQAPHQLRADVTSDRKDRQFFFDGSTFTIFSPKVGYYAQVTLPANSTNGDLADMLENKYGLELPLVDVFRFGTDKIDMKKFTNAAYIGTATIDGVETDQYAFRQPGLDWQIWIEHGDKPVPRRLVLTTTDEEARPEHAIDMTWKLDAKLDSKEFAFKPPQDAKKIVISELSARQQNMQGRSAPRYPTREN